MDTPRPPIVFNGTTGTECEEFIAAVKQYAFDKGQQRNLEWIADLASTCLRGEALRWHSTLDEEVQHNWRRLQIALLERFPSDTQSNEQPPAYHSVVTNPPVRHTSPRQSGSAPAVRPARPSPFTGPVRKGRLRVITSDASIGGYIMRAFGAMGNVRLTQNESKALHVEFEPSDAYRNIRMLNLDVEGNNEWLGITFTKHTVRFNKDSPDFASLAAVTASPPGRQCTTTSYQYNTSCPTQSALWKVASGSTESEVTCGWTDSVGTVSLLYPVVALHPSSSLVLCVNPNRFGKYGRSARIVFEPVQMS